jgi:hypothetical protein
MMSSLRALLHQRETRAAVALWSLIPTVFLFFALTLAVDPVANLDRLRLGVTMLDQGVETPQGQVAVGPRLIEGLTNELGIDAVTYSTEADLRTAVEARDVSGGVVVPAGMTVDLQAGYPVELTIVRTDANDSFGNAFMTNLAGQLAANLNAVVPAIVSGQPPALPAIAVATENLAATPDFRFPALPGTLLLPLWIASVAFAALLSRSGDRVRATAGASRTGIAELVVAAVAAGIASAVITLDVALFSWRSDIDLVGLFGLLWLGLIAIGWLLLGTVRLVGLGAGVVLGVLALFIQQPVSGAAFPATFAPDVVRWAEPVAPLRYLVEGVRNVLIGGSTTTDVVVALGLLAVAGAVLVAAGTVRLSVGADRNVPRETLATA